MHFHAFYMRYLTRMVLPGYGMTESCGMCAILPPECMRYGSVGLPVPSIEIKLLDVAEAGYTSKNNPPTVSSVRSLQLRSDH